MDQIGIFQRGFGSRSGRSLEKERMNKHVSWEKLSPGRVPQTTDSTQILLLPLTMTFLPAKASLPVEIYNFGFFRLLQIYSEKKKIDNPKIRWSQNPSCTLGYFKSPLLQINFFKVYKRMFFFCYIFHPPSIYHILTMSQIRHEDTQDKKPVDENQRGEWKSWLKAQHSEN